MTESSDDDFSLIELKILEVFKKFADEGKHVVSEGDVLVALGDDPDTIPAKMFEIYYKLTPKGHETLENNKLASDNLH